MPQSDQEMTTIHVRRAVGGDEESLGWIVERLSPLLLSQARYRLSRHLRGLYDPEDMVQEAWMTALGKLGDLVPRKDRITPVLIKFLSQILLNQYRNLLHKHVHGKPLRVPITQDSSAAGLESQLMGRDQIGVVTNAIRSEVGERVLRSIESLGEIDKEIVILRGIEQAANHEISLIMNLEEGTVATRYHRALQKLRASMPESVFSELPDALI